MQGQNVGLLKDLLQSLRFGTGSLDFSLAKKRVVGEHPHAESGCAPPRLATDAAKADQSKSQGAEPPDGVRQVDACLPLGRPQRIRSEPAMEREKHRDGMRGHFFDAVVGDARDGDAEQFGGRDIYVVDTDAVPDDGPASLEPLKSAGRQLESGAEKNALGSRSPGENLLLRQALEILDCGRYRSEDLPLNVEVWEPVVEDDDALGQRIDPSFRVRPVEESSGWRVVTRRSSNG